MRRVSRTLEAMAGSLDRLLGLLVADTEMRSGVIVIGGVDRGCHDMRSGS